MRAVSLVLAAALALPGAASAQQCATSQDADRYQLLRRLSLDVRGRLPSLDEYAALDGATDVPAATIESWLKTDDFRAAMRRYHESLFWPNVTRTRISEVNNSLTNTRPGFTDAAFIVGSAGRRKLYRGNQDAPCGDYQQTNFDPAHPNEFRPDPAHVQTTTLNGATAVQEGWRMVTPYWAPATQIKVCAYEAQETLAVPDGKGGTISCASSRGEGVAACGCGPNLKWCYGPGTVTPILTSLREQLDRAVDEVSTGGAPYTDLLLQTKASVNGPIAFWRKNLAPHTSLGITYNAPDPQEELVDKDFTDATWQQVDRGPFHAGVLTLPGYLLRFQTDRGRANRFRIDFLCSYFVPPAHLEDSAAGNCADNDPDITHRCNCRYCHAVLEPMASYFGLFTLAGTTLMTDPARFPKSNPACKGNNNAFGVCGRFYVTQADAHNAGALQPYQWADVHPELVGKIEGGPRLLAQESINRGDIARCTVTKLYDQLLNQPMYPEGTAQTPLLDSLASGFAQSNYSLPWLVEQIVRLPEYRRAN